ncbi:hypothetical protein AVEN_180020-1 [Araneus ventricosus]|uniref:Uncharacterized protein n=1 Tax=Araneus ventricosus TaxID=182803 RepID=A0A4Y2GYP8_ARAVE|nr:hypothetical protein AVEN_180020-1 [Araneus ventricosus]
MFRYYRQNYAVLNLEYSLCVLKSCPRNHTSTTHSFREKCKRKNTVSHPVKDKYALLNLVKLQAVMNELPPRSPDLTPLDFFQCLHLKELVCRAPVTSENDLVARLHAVFTYVNTMRDVGSCAVSHSTTRASMSRNAR